MSDIPDSFDNYLAEISKSLTGSSGEETLRRINAERILKIFSEDIVQDYPELHIRFLTDNRIAGQSGADLLMQVDDYEIRWQRSD